VKLNELIPDNESFERMADQLEAIVKRRKPAKVANDNAKLSPGWATTINKLETNNGTVPKKERFQITWFDDVDKTTTKEEIVKGVLGAGEFSLFVAKPGMGKSVLVGDIGMHIAAGMDWHGKKVKQGLVVFFAAERKKITERRVAAWGKKHGVTKIPFVVVGGKLDLTTGLIDAKSLAATIKNLEEKSGFKCVLIILDTVTRTFGPGDQHQSRDMQRYVQSVDELHRATTAHIAAIHHSPWSDDRGKGAIDLDGAIDVSFVVNVTGTGLGKVFTLTCTGANDGEDGPVTSFRLESVELGTDADGNVTAAPVVVQADKPFDGAELKGHTAKVLDSLERAIEKHGECPPDGSPGFPDGVVTVTRDEWREQFYSDAKVKEPNILDAALRQRFTRATGDLLKAAKYVAVGERVWLA
jgi:AAA domain